MRNESLNTGVKLCEWAYAANAVDECRKTVFAANLHSGVS